MAGTSRNERYLGVIKTGEAYYLSEKKNTGIKENFKWKDVPYVWIGMLDTINMSILP